MLTDPIALTPPNMASDAVKNALRAILARDSDSAEAAIDTAVASGLGRAAAMRLWSLSQLAKGDISEAVRALRRARTANGSGKQALTAALILLEAGYVIDAVRSALDALATTRRAGEARGEQAALLVLGGCYRRLGRGDEALLLEAHAG
jgi:tetratricopeptide (TPR) repeat protein